MNYDVKAMTKIYDWLKPEGVCYVSVPYGKTSLVGRLDGVYKEHPPDKWEWRIYSKQALQDRIIQKFHVDSIDYFMAARHDQKVDGVVTVFEQGQVLTEAEASTIEGPSELFSSFTLNQRMKR